MSSNPAGVRRTLHPLHTPLIQADSPYFFNAGVFHSAALVSAISSAYAHTITDFLKANPSVPRPDVIFGYPSAPSPPLLAIHS